MKNVYVVTKHPEQIIFLDISKERQAGVMRFKLLIPIKLMRKRK